VGHVAKKQEIKTVSFVHIGDQLVNTDDLDREQRCRLATLLKTAYLNTLFRGRAEFFACGREEEAPGTPPAAVEKAQIGDGEK